MSVGWRHVPKEFLQPKNVMTDNTITIQKHTTSVFNINTNEIFSSVESYLNFNTATDIISRKITRSSHNIRLIIIKFRKVTIFYYMTIIILLVKFYAIVTHHIIFWWTKVINNVEYSILECGKLRTVVGAIYHWIE